MTVITKKYYDSSECIWIEEKNTDGSENEKFELYPSLNDVRVILVNQQRIIQQPLASTSNWSKWNDALTVSMWISAFAKLCSHYLNQLGIKDNEKLDTLLKLSHSLAMIRPLEEWNSESELIKFVEWIENLLSNQKEIFNSTV